MSIPKNHHYVSECHIDNFFNHSQKKIFYYDKKLSRFDYKITKKSIFSEEYANSRLKDGEIDHRGLEDELNKEFETPFPRNFANIKEIINDARLFDTHINSLENLVKFAIININRHPTQKAHFDNQIEEIFREQIISNAVPELVEQIENMFSFVGKTKYSNPTNYKDIADGVFELMGKITYTIFEINTNDYFILPDWYSIVERVDYAPDSGARVVALVGIPLSSKIFLLAQSHRIIEEPNSVVKITTPNSKIVRDLNDALYRQAVKTVACESEDYLYAFINDEI